MGFPREVRDMVYEHALCVDGVLAPCEEIFKVNGDYRGPPPTVALLATNRQIRKEALPVLFGKNTWRITSGAKKLKFRYKREGEGESEYKRALELASVRGGSATLLGRYGELIRRVVLDCNFQDTGDHTNDVTNIHDSVVSMVSDERMKRLHYQSVRRSISCWTEKQYIFWHICEVTSIVIDISHLYCALGCCRLDMIKGLFRHHFLHIAFTTLVKKWNMKLPIFQVKGTRNKEEEEVVEAWLQGLKEPAFSQKVAEV